ncbi:hypothetical protein FB567DRAFT_593038 [Paraphoma chrysanthemicola]|uniref:Borealin N-terminal domain-containing protein n=1 Tax=Paraphoma chrysanthemicola TaxID=798071 RepID=A0A8K0R7Z3_9PLEO|nr:hypothetical protein FB567DRAFT_593038 [Paraphoma chrysanthemicola]
MPQLRLTAEAKAAMIANFTLELKNRTEQLHATAEAQCASMRDRLERRVNRIPAAQRQKPLVELLAPLGPLVRKAAAINAASVVTAAPTTTVAPPIAAAPTTSTRTAAGKKAPAPKRAPQPKTSPAATTSPEIKTSPLLSEKALAPVTRKGRAAPTPKPATQPVSGKLARHTATRAKKRSSAEMSSEDKENAALDVPRKRVRAAAQKPAPAVNKPAPTTRTTRAASRQKPAAAQILSPKNNNARQKPAAKPATRPR